jgi:cytochrome c553
MRAWFCGVLFLTGSAFAQTPQQERLKAVLADPAALKLAVDAGRQASFFCANCHGVEGVSKSPDVPNLAAQNPAYLLEQIRKFGSGERKDQFMQGMIKVLKDDERVQIALFYAAAKVVPAKTDSTQAALGKAIFAKNCARCHGEQAHGNETYPRLAGQKAAYLQSSITRYRDNTGERTNPLMSIATAFLKNEDIVALTHYLGSMP